jgi:hypothetical protein
MVCSISEKPQQLLSFKSEMRTLMKLKHPNIVKLVGTSVRYPDMILVEELCAEGSLHKLIYHDLPGTNVPFTYRDILRICDDVTDAMVYCHAQSIVHRGEQHDPSCACYIQYLATWMCVRGSIMGGGCMESPFKQTCMCAYVLLSVCH